MHGAFRAGGATISDARHTTTFDKCAYNEKAARGRLFRFVDPRGFEPLTPCMPCRCATNCATGPRAHPLYPTRGGANDRLAGIPHTGWVSQPVTVSITRIVDPAQARQFAAWARSGEELMRTYPGYLGSGWIRPDPASHKWHMLFRFADAESLARWQESDERRWWMESALGIVEQAKEERVTGIEGWFDRPSSVEAIPSAPPPPPRWKQMVSIFIVFFPLSLLANWALSPLTADWPLVFRVLLTVVLVTPVMTYVAMPLVTRALRPWLMKNRA